MLEKVIENSYSLSINASQNILINCLLRSTLFISNFFSLEKVFFTSNFEYKDILLMDEFIDMPTYPIEGRSARNQDHFTTSFGHLLALSQWDG